MSHLVWSQAGKHRPCGTDSPTLPYSHHHTTPHMCRTAKGTQNPPPNPEPQQRIAAGLTCLPASAEVVVSVQPTLGQSTMIPIDKASAGLETVQLPTSLQAGDLPPIGLSLRKSESLLDLVNQHLACVQG